MPHRGGRFRADLSAVLKSVNVASPAAGLPRPAVTARTSIASGLPPSRPATTARVGSGAGRGGADLAEEAGPAWRSDGRPQRAR